MDVTPIERLQEHTRKRTEGHRRYLERFDRVYSLVMAAHFVIGGLACLAVPSAAFFVSGNTTALALLGPALISSLLAFSGARHFLAPATQPKRDALGQIV